MIHLCAFCLPALPLLLLLAFLLFGRYPGCDAILRLSERIAARGEQRRGAVRPRCPLRPPTRAASGGQLLARALSGRAPPVAPSF